MLLWSKERRHKHPPRIQSPTRNQPCLQQTPAYWRSRFRHRENAPPRSCQAQQRNAVSGLKKVRINPPAVKCPRRTCPSSWCNHAGELFRGDSNRNFKFLVKPRVIEESRHPARARPLTGAIRICGLDPRQIECFLQSLKVQSHAGQGSQHSVDFRKLSGVRQTQKKRLHGKPERATARTSGEGCGSICPI